MFRQPIHSILGGLGGKKLFHTMKAFLVVLMAFMAFTSTMAKALEPAASGTPAEDLEWLQYLNEDRFEKRGGPSDPRSLFNHVYSNYNLG